MHEFVASAATLKAETGIKTLDVAKRLIDYGFHPPTIYFPLTVEEALLIEPTESESIEVLDAFVAALRAIVAEARTDPDLLHSAPHSSPVRRLDETTAARQPNLRWKAMTGSQRPCPTEAIPHRRWRLHAAWSEPRTPRGVEYGSGIRAWTQLGFWGTGTRPNGGEERPDIPTKNV